MEITWEEMEDYIGVPVHVQNLGGGYFRKFGKGNPG